MTSSKIENFKFDRFFSKLVKMVKFAVTNEHDAEVHSISLFATNNMTPYAMLNHLARDAEQQRSPEAEQCCCSNVLRIYPSWSARHMKTAGANIQTSACCWSGRHRQLTVSVVKVAASLSILVLLLVLFLLIWLKILEVRWWHLRHKDRYSLAPL